MMKKPAGAFKPVMAPKMPMSRPRAPKQKLQIASPMPMQNSAPMQNAQPMNNSAPMPMNGPQGATPTPGSGSGY